MKISHKTAYRIDCGDYPRYETKRGKLLWVSELYDHYSSANHCRILEDANGRFWGYSDNPNIVKIGGKL
jgi:hypothetical protein